MKEKYKILAKNSILFAIANFGSKLLKFLIVPLYTYYLTTAEYGTVDILITTLNLISPIVLLGLNEAALRFSLNPRYTHEQVFSNCMCVFTIMSIISCSIYWIFEQVSLLHEYWWIFYSLLILSSLEVMFLSFLKGTGHNIQFAIAGLLNTIIFLGTNILFLVFLNLGIRGYLYSMILGTLASVLFMIISTRMHRNFALKLWNWEMIKDLLRYSFPLMPNSIMWWIMNASDRYVILLFLGEAAAGIYAVSYKIPSILSVMTSVFHQAWQISAIQEDGASDKSGFYGSVFNIYSEVLFLGSSLIIMFIRPLITLVTQYEYHSAWKYVPFLLLGAVFSGMCSFEGVNYTVSGKTVGAFSTSVIGAIINIVFNIMLTPFIGLQGTAIATFVSYYILWRIRASETKRLKRYKIDYRKIHISLFILLIQIVLLFADIKGEIILQIVMFGLLLFINRDVLNFIKGTLKKVRVQ